MVFRRNLSARQFLKIVQLGLLSLFGRTPKT